MPEEGIQLKSHAEILRYEQMANIVEVGATLGITKVRLTGGEPLVKRNIEFLVQKVSTTPGILETCMTSNGSLLTIEKARLLKKAGLTRINISLDTLDRERFARITRCGEIEDVFRGIDAALDANLKPVKINMLIFEDTSIREIEAMRDFCSRKGTILQTIQRFSLQDKKSSGSFSTDRPPQCRCCNRIRLTADGFLKPCLFSDHEIRVDFQDIEGSLRAAVRGKPVAGETCKERPMSQIGG